MEPKGDKEFYEALQRHKRLTDSINKRSEYKMSRYQDSRVSNKDSKIYRSRSQYETFMKNKGSKSKSKSKQKSRDGSFKALRDKYSRTFLIDFINIQNFFFNLWKILILTKRIWPRKAQIIKFICQTVKKKQNGIEQWTALSIQSPTLQPPFQKPEYGKRFKNKQISVKTDQQTKKRETSEVK